MEPVGRNPKPATPVRDPHQVKENTNPNLVRSSPGLNAWGSPAVKSAKAKKSGSKNPGFPEQNVVVCSPRKKIRERKFVVAKKKKKNVERTDGEGAAGLGPVECKCREKIGDGRKCLCVAYESLRASHEEFFKNRAEGEDEKGELGEKKEEIEAGDSNGSEDGLEGPVETGSPMMKRRRDKLLEQARNSVPEFGKVKHLVKAFEQMLTMRELKEKEDREEEEKEEKRKAMQWALPGLQVPAQVAHGGQVSASGFCSSDFFLTSENLGLDSRFSVSSSWDGNQDSISSRTSNGSRRSRRNSSESCGIMDGGRRGKKKQMKATSLKPFMLRTEQRGKMKEEEFVKKLQEMMIEEEKQRIPIAQGLPWTTDEPECLIKPPVKEPTRPVDLKLHSDVRAVERAEFDHQVFEKLSLIEQYKMERERQQKLAEEEELRRLRKELIPKAQPMPYFDRPFIPRRSVKHPTIAREPKFHLPQHKKIKCCVSWNDISSYTCQQ